MQDAEIIEKLTRLEERMKSNSKRLDEHDRKIEDIHDLTYAVKELANETKMMREDLNSLTNRVTTIENEPANEYKDVKKNIRNQIITFIIGVIITAIGALIIK